MTIFDILRSKGSGVITVEPDTPVQDAVRVLVDNNIGAVLVHDDRLRGIFTERDVLRAAATDVVRLQVAKVRDLMTAEVITVTPEHDIGHVMDVMTERGIRHLPVVENGAVCGMISIRDVVNALRQNAETENRQLQAYILGTPL